ncbi:hypothetical protein Riv7116_2187 [Rivularia sp. PCC 7116]|uniref:hypothetical protein n=1 Tax=Rivularia sp. PCC 7116 TaxID=373994 RepID=UPI00029ED9CE|nr:hypothetical protein [Rivularia sp. PCC 7116]AFY54713.1 hypothetical protein Riv7116_2187 [Rivularia sp. PCC 7116]
MKTVVIGGVCRTGKSRLANKVFQNTKSTVFHGDHLMNILYNNFTGLDKNQFPKVLIKLIRNMGKEFRYTRIFESCHVDPIIAKSKLNCPSYIFLFLGYPQVNIDRKIRELREYAAKNPECWTHQHEDDSLISHIKEYALLSREQQIKCQQANIPYFDTSDNFNYVWNQAYDYVMQKLGE